MRRAYHPQTAKKYIISVITLAIVASALLVGSVGSMIQVASARNDSRRYSGYSNQQRNSNSSHNSSSRDTNSPQQTNQKSGANDSPTKTTQKTQTPAVQSRQSTPPQNSASAATATPPVQSKPAIQKTTPTITPPDSAPAINQMNEAQATTEVAPVTYSSARISDETRNRIFIFAGVAAVTGALLYTMSYVTMGALTGRRPVPVRYVVPVNGAARS